MATIRISPSGRREPVAFRGGVLRQNPNAPQTILAGATAIVLSQTIALEPGQGVMAIAMAAAENAGGGAGDLLANLRSTVAPAPPTTLRSGADPAVAAGGSGRVALMAAFIPGDVNVASTVVIDVEVSAVGQNFNVGTQPDGGCSLLCLVTQLDGSFQLITASP